MTTAEGTIGALDGVRVIDFGHYLPGPLAGMLLADAGADVVKVDPPGGARWKTNANVMLERGKTRIELDLATDRGRERALALIASADVVIENFRPGVMERLGLGPDDARAVNPSMVYCRISGFARTDPRSAMPGWEAIVASATSIYRPPQKFPGDPTAGDVPAFIATPLLSTYAAFVAAHSMAAALIGRRRTGRGDVIDVSLYDVAFEIFGAELQMQHDRSVGAFDPPVKVGLGHYQGSDGEWLHFCLFAERHVRWFVETFAPEWIDEGLGDRATLHANPDLQEELARRLKDLVATRPAAEWEREINERSGAPVALCQTTQRWLEDAHGYDSGALAKIDDPELGATRQLGQAVVLSGTPLQPKPRTPSATYDDVGTAASTAPTGLDGDDSVLPLDGMKVVDFTQVLAGPTAGRILAEYGAEVTKINKTTDSGIMCHAWINSGKNSILLDVKAPEAQGVLDTLIAEADVVSQNFALGVADRLGFGPEAVLDAHPDTICVYINAFGPSGYRSTWRGREELGQAVSGLQAKWRTEDGEPAMLTFPVSDIGSGHLAAFGALLGLYARLDGKPGQQVTASLAHSATFFQTPFMLWSERDGAEPEPPQGQDATGWGPNHRLYRAADGFFCLVVDQLDGLEGLEGVDTSDVAAVEARIAQSDVATWCARAVGAGGAAHAVRTGPEMLNDGVAWDRNLLVDLGGDRLKIGVPPRFAATPVRAGLTTFEPGAHGKAVIDGLGFGDQWESLVASGAVVAPSEPQ